MSQTRNKLWLVAGGLFLGLVLFAYFRLIGGQDRLLLGHDHYTTGHMMLLAKTHLQTGFGTPCFFPMEDPFGPVVGWSPYPGQPPLPALLTAAVLRWRGVSIANARLLPCAMTTLSTLLVLVLAWRVTGRVMPTVLAVVTFAGNGLITKYAGFAWNDTFALAWSLLLITLYPTWVVGGGGDKVALFAGLTAVGGWLSWHCYLAPVACAAAWALADRPQWRAQWRRWAVPLAVAFVNGLIVVSVLRYLTQTYEPNGWLDASLGSNIVDKLLTWLGMKSPHLIVHHVLRAGRYLFNHLGPFAFATVLVVGAQAWRQSPPAAAAASSPTGDFYLHALWLYPVLWTVALPVAMGHEFQVISYVPFGAVLFAWVIVRTAPTPRGSAWLTAAGLALVLPVAVYVTRESYRQPDDARWAQLQADIQEHTPPGMLVVMGWDDRGVWWRMQRPMISLSRLARVGARPHRLVLPTGASAPVIERHQPLWEGRYRVLVERRFTDHPYYDYAILEPLAPAAP